MWSLSSPPDPSLYPGRTDVASYSLQSVTSLIHLDVITVREAMGERRGDGGEGETEGRKDKGKRVEGGGKRGGTRDNYMYITVYIPYAYMYIIMEIYLGNIYVN